MPRIPRVANAKLEAWELERGNYDAVRAVHVMRNSIEGDGTNDGWIERYREPCR